MHLFRSSLFYSTLHNHLLNTDGSKDKLLYINDELNKLRHLYDDKVITMGGTLGALYNIKNIAIEMYDFYFYNKLFFASLKRSL